MDEEQLQRDLRENKRALDELWHAVFGGPGTASSIMARMRSVEEDMKLHLIEAAKAQRNIWIGIASAAALSNALVNHFLLSWLGLGGGK